MQDGKFLIKSILSWSLIVSLVGVPIAVKFGGWNFAFAWIVGAVWNWCNFLLISFFIPLLIKSPDTSLDKSLLIKVLIGFLTLFIAGFYIVRFGLIQNRLNPLGIIAGFSVIFLVMVLKALGKSLFKDQTP